MSVSIGCGRVTCVTCDQSTSVWISHTPLNRMDETWRCLYVTAEICTEMLPTLCGIMNGKGTFLQFARNKVWNKLGKKGTFCVDGCRLRLIRNAQIRSQVARMILICWSFVRPQTWSRRLKVGRFGTCLAKSKYWFLTNQYIVSLPYSVWLSVCSECDIGDKVCPSGCTSFDRSCHIVDLANEMSTVDLNFFTFIFKVIKCCNRLNDLCCWVTWFLKHGDISLLDLPGPEVDHLLILLFSWKRITCDDFAF